MLSFWVTEKYDEQTVELSINLVAMTLMLRHWCEVDKVDVLKMKTLCQEQSSYFSNFRIGILIGKIFLPHIELQREAISYP